MVGTAEHMRATFERMTSINVTKKDQKVTIRDWFSWVKRMLSSFAGNWHILLLCLTFMGIKSKIFLDGELPLFAFLKAHAGSFDQDEHLLAPEAGANREEVQQNLRMKCRKTLVLSCRLLADPGRRSRCMILTHCSRPIFTAHSKESEKVRSEEGTLAYCIGWACGSYKLALQNVLATLGNRTILKQIGFQLSVPTMTIRFGGTSSSSSSGNAVASSLLNLCESEVALATDMFNFCLGVVRSRSMSLAHWTTALPEAFAPLLSDNLATVTKQLAFMSDVWNAMQELEQRRLDSDAAANLFEATIVSLILVLHFPLLHFGS